MRNKRNLNFNRVIEIKKKAKKKNKVRLFHYFVLQKCDMSGIINLIE